jgi:C4-type Zn-finger protein
MDKGEGIMPVPQGVISTSEGPVDPVQEVVQVLDEAIAEADKEEAVEEYLPEIEQDDLL